MVLLVMMSPILRAAWTGDILSSEEGSLVRAQLGLPSAGHIIAVGHFTTERRLDCVIMDTSRTVATIYVMRPTEGHYVKSKAMAPCPSGHEIVAAILSDFDHDGHADLLLMHRVPKTTMLQLTVFLGDGETLTLAPWSVEAARGQVAVVDFDGLMQLSLLGSAVNATSTRPAVWRNKAITPNELSTGFEKPLAIHEFGHLSKFPYVIQGDFNGDGKADLLLTYSEIEGGPTDGIEVWIRFQEGDKVPYQLAVRRKLPPGSGPVAMADVDGDGHLDVVFAVCFPPENCAIENSIHIMYNVQRRFCSNHKHYDGCQDVDELFNERGETFEFQGNGDSPHHVVVSIGQLFPKDDDVRVLFVDPIAGQPVSLSVGDYDLDSYSDLAIVLGSRSKPDQLENSRVALLRSVPCTKTTCTGAQMKADRRTFEAVTKQVEALTNLRRVVGVAFADLFDLGPPGFLVNYYDGPNMQHMSIRNGISRDAFSLRTETLNGVCPAPCQSASAGSRAERPLAVNYVGASYRITFVDDEGATQVRSGSQLSQTMNGALQSPTVLFGLGRTSNFIQNIEVGIVYRFGVRTYSKTNIFPNSEIIFFPPHADSAGAWRAELQIHPGEYIVYVIISIACALVVLAIITGIFKWQEKREDDLERKKATHLINFDAL